MRIAEESKERSWFSVIDLTVDLSILAWLVALAMGFDPGILLPDNKGFVSAAVDMIALFLGYFGLALYASRMYSAAALKHDEKRHHRLLFPSVGFGILSALIVITILLSGGLLISMRALPIFSSILVIVQSVLFGFAFGVDLDVERRRLEDREFKTQENPYNLSLSNFPYLLMTILFVFPTEYFNSTTSSAPLSKGFLVLIACLAAVLFGRRLDKAVFQKLRIGAKMTSQTSKAVTAFMILGLVGFGVLYSSGVTILSIGGNTQAGRLGALIIFGILPVRIGAIVFSRSSLLNKALGLAALAGLLLLGTGLIQV